MQAALPIKLNELFKLTNVGLNPDLFKFGNLTLESEKYICVKDGNVSSLSTLNLNYLTPQAIVIDLVNRTASLLTQARDSQLTESQ